MLQLGESGIILLSGGSQDASSDYDLEEFTSEPVVECNIIFEGDNILINGRSNLQSKPKLQKVSFI